MKQEGSPDDTDEAVDGTEPDAAAADATAPQRLAAGQPRVAGPGASRAARLGVFAVVVALGAVAASGFLWWQYRAFYVSLDAADGAAMQALDRMRAELTAVEDELAAAEARLDAAAREREAVRAELDAWPSRLATLERRVDAVAGGTRAARERWLRAEAEYYLGVASTALDLADDWDAAITALELADGRLRELGDPRLAPVREQIAAERLALESVARPDVEGLALGIGRLAGRIDTLPLRGAAESADAPATVDAEPGVGRLLAGLRSAMSSLVRIERRDAPVAQALSAAERRLVRRRVELALDLARVALVRGETRVYRTSLETATELLEREFDTRSPAVGGALDALAGFLGTEVAPDKPDIGGSLARLRALPDGAQ